MIATTTKARFKLTAPPPATSPANPASQFDHIPEQLDALAALGRLLAAGWGVTVFRVPGRRGAAGSSSNSPAEFSAIARRGLVTQAEVKVEGVGVGEVLVELADACGLGVEQ